jgi:hypothetical protein
VSTYLPVHSSTLARGLACCTRCNCDCPFTHVFVGAFLTRAVVLLLLLLPPCTLLLLLLLQGLLQALGVKQCVVVGHSAGAGVAVDLALRCVQWLGRLLQLGCGGCSDCLVTSLALLYVLSCTGCCHIVPQKVIVLVTGAGVANTVQLLLQ